jgi:Transposase DDE domain group 1
VQAAIAAIPEHAWTPIDYPEGGIAQVAETTLADERLVVRRTRLTGPRPPCGPTGATTPSSPIGPAAPWSWTPTTAATPSANSPSATSKTAPGCATALRGLPGQRRLAVIVTLAHNLLRWLATIGLGGSGPVVAKTLRRRLLHLPGRITRSARRCLLHLPTDWPWAAQFLHTLARLRALPAPD